MTLLIVPAKWNVTGAAELSLPRKKRLASATASQRESLLV
jgi:hypothetical protein